MNRVAAVKILPVSFFAVICFAGTHLAPAQQTPDAAMTGLYSSMPDASSGTAAPAAPGIYSDAAALSRTSAEGLASQMGQANSNQANSNSAIAKSKGAKISRSAWMAGSASVGVGSAGVWVPEASGFASRGAAASWVAGADTFGMQRQQDGIWHVLPGTEVPAESASQAGAISSASSLAAGPRHFSTGLTPKGTALIGRSFSSSFAARRGAGSGFGSSLHGPFVQHGFTGAQNPFAPHAKASGNTRGAGSALQAPSSRTLANPSMPAEPSLDDTLRLNPKLDSPGPETTPDASDLSH